MKLPYLLTAAIACVIIWLIPDTIHFRDSGEFHLVAHYLDISHPAGFPVYAELANVISLLPFGPVVWRTHVFSVVAILLWLCTILWIVNALREKYFPRSPSFLVLLSILPLLVSFPTWKSAFTAEVYGLNAFLLTLCAAIYLQFFLKNDFRYLGLLSIAATLTLGNHVASVVILVPLAILWSYKRIPFLFSLSLAAATAALTLLLYLYIPLRAQTPLPLSSGAPTTFSRFMSVITNERDSALRPGSESGSTENYLEKTVQTGLSDLTRLASELPRYASLLGFLGFGLLFLTAPTLGITFFVIGAGILLFFSGWDVDPWLPAFGVISIFSLIPVFFVTHHLSGQATRRIFALLTSTALVFLSGSHFSLETIENMASDRSAEISAQRTLEKIPANGTFFVEPSWFLLRAETLLEGRRDDITLVNIPEVLFPRYFHPARIKNSEQDFDAGHILLESDYGPRSPALRNIGRVINTACKQSSCVTEAHPVLSKVLKEVLILDSAGILKVVPNQSYQVSEQFLSSILETLEGLKNTGCRTCGSLTYDRWNYAEVIVNNHVDTLLERGQKENAENILVNLCNNPELLRCSAVSVTNLIRLASGNGRPCNLLRFLVPLREVQPSVRIIVGGLSEMCRKAGPLENVIAP